MIAETLVYSIPLKFPMLGMTHREGMLINREGVWSEWSPFLELDDAAASRWLAAALEDAKPQLQRASVPLNVTIPAIAPQDAAELARVSSCMTAKVSVADGAAGLDEDLARVAAVREAIGANGQLRIEVNGAWTVPFAVQALAQFAQFNLQFAEQPVASLVELAELRRELDRHGIEVPIAADESINVDPTKLDVAAIKDAADFAVLKVQPLGGVQPLLEIAEQLDMPTVVSSTLETSIGLHAGIRAAASLPNIRLGCGLDTVRLLAADVVPMSVQSQWGAYRVAGRPRVDEQLAAAVAADEERTAWWQQRYERCSALLTKPVA